MRRGDERDDAFVTLMASSVLVGTLAMRPMVAMPACVGVVGGSVGGWVGELPQ